jgi:hypothetical protein
MSQPSPFKAIEPPTGTRRVRPSDRFWDAAALILVGFGVVLFFFARHALNALAAGTYRTPTGVTFVGRTDLHVAQTRMAIWFIVMGMLVGVTAALRHKLRERT